jgi:hypothetical protein
MEISCKFLKFKLIPTTYIRNLMPLLIIVHAKSYPTGHCRDYNQPRSGKGLPDNTVSYNDL